MQLNVVNSVRHLLVYGTAMFALGWLSQSWAELSLNGVAKYQESGRLQFLAGLYSLHPENNAIQFLSSKTPKKVEIRVQAERLSSSRLRDMWLNGLSINAQPAEQKYYSKEIITLGRYMKVRLKRGDIMAIERNDQAIHFYLNDIQMGTIEKPDFFEVMLSAWLGSVPVSREFKHSLMSAGRVDNELYVEFESIGPSDERYQEVLANLKPTPSKSDSTIQAPKIQPVVHLPKNLAEDSFSVRHAMLPMQAPAKLTTAQYTQTKPKPSKAQKRVEKPAKIEESIEVEKPSNSTTVKATVTQKPAEQQVLSLKPAPKKTTPEEKPAPPSTEERYQQAILNWAMKYFHYPEDAIAEQENGNLTLSITLRRNGELESIDVIEASVHHNLNRFAVLDAKKANPFPAIPPSLGRDHYTFDLPITYTIKNNQKGRVEQINTIEDNRLMISSTPYIDPAIELAAAQAKLDKESYYNQVRKRALSNIDYPHAAAAKAKQGQVKLQITLVKTGQLVEVKLLEGSEHDILNQYAMRDVKRSGPFPGFPDSFSEEQISLVLPVNYVLN